MTYLPVAGRASSLDGISSTLERIAAGIEKSYSDVRALCLNPPEKRRAVVLCVDAPRPV
ncbi:MAG: hypothetical protein ACREFX_12695 [Opitutaceae bacterium]